MRVNGVRCKRERCSSDGRCLGQPRHGAQGDAAVDQQRRMLLQSRRLCSGEAGERFLRSTGRMVPHAHGVLCLCKRHAKLHLLWLQIHGSEQFRHHLLNIVTALRMTRPFEVRGRTLGAKLIILFFLQPVATCRRLLCNGQRRPVGHCRLRWAVSLQQHVAEVALRSEYRARSCALIRCSSAEIELCRRKVTTLRERRAAINQRVGASAAHPAHATTIAKKYGNKFLPNIFYSSLRITRFFLTQNVEPRVGATPSAAARRARMA